MGQTEGIIGRVIGFLAIGPLAYGMLCKTKKEILLSQIVSSTIVFFSYLLIGASTAIGTSILAMIRSVIFNWKDSKKWASIKLWPYIFIASAVVTATINWEGMISLSPLIAYSFFTIALWVDDTKKTRILNIACILTLIIYDIQKVAVGHIITLLIELVSTIIGLIKYNISGKVIKRLSEH